MTLLHRTWLVGLLVAACGGGGTEPVDDGTTRISLTTGLRFSPSDITIDPGTTVRWVASTSTFHTVTPANVQQEGVWARATSQQTGTVLTHTFTIPGQVYSYFCEPHQTTGMTGVIRVR